MSFVRKAFIFAKHDNPNAELCISVQASAAHYCTPRTDDAEVYTAVEVALPWEQKPSNLSPELKKYDECFDSMGIAGWMPSARAKELLTDIARIWGPCINPHEAGKPEDQESAQARMQMGLALGLGPAIDQLRAQGLLPEQT